jgi:hypothetical protein
MRPSDPPASIVALAEALARALTDDLSTPALENPEGWRLVAVTPRFFQIWRALIELRTDTTSLGFLISPTDPAERAYRRTARWDFVYFSEDVPDPEQDRIYQRDRATIDRFASWLEAWDRRTAA